jgi:predicted DNA-binding transcriptional regulator AlpA
VPAVEVRERYGISDVALWRWLRDPKLKFPQPAMRVLDRRYWLEEDLIAWERSMIPHDNQRQVAPA